MFKISLAWYVQAPTTAKAFDKFKEEIKLRADELQLGMLDIQDVSLKEEKEE